METTGVIIVESLPKITVALLKNMWQNFKVLQLSTFWFGPEDHGEVY